MSVLRIGYLILGFVSLAVGAIGAFLPLLPTVPFVLLAAFCFARSNRRLEQWLLDSRFGPHIRLWRTHRATTRNGKRAAFAAFGASALIGLATLPLPWMLVPLLAAAIGGWWIRSLPELPL